MIYEEYTIWVVQGMGIASGVPYDKNILSIA